MALAGGLIRNERLDEQASWHATWFCSPSGYPIALGVAPRTVDTVINHRVINRRHIVAGVSGGVRVDPQALVDRSAWELDSYGLLPTEHDRSEPPADLPSGAWWWDQGK